jgi:hypothetical protein
MTGPDPAVANLWGAILTSGRLTLNIHRPRKQASDNT